MRSTTAAAARLTTATTRLATATQQHNNTTTATQQHSNNLRRRSTGCSSFFCQHRQISPNTKSTNTERETERENRLQRALSHCQCALPTLSSCSCSLSVAAWAALCYAAAACLPQHALSTQRTLHANGCFDGAFTLRPFPLRLSRAASAFHV